MPYQESGRTKVEAVLTEVAVGGYLHKPLRQYLTYLHTSG